MNDAIRASAAVFNAIQEGALRRPKRCERCNKKAFVLAHHHIDYSPDHYLDVQWLCRSCHTKEHVSNPDAPARPPQKRGNHIRVLIAPGDPLLEFLETNAKRNERSVSAEVRFLLRNLLTQSAVGK